MAKKKWARINVWLLCTVDNAQNYITTINKTKNAKMEIIKYCPKCRKHTTHKSREKLK